MTFVTQYIYWIYIYYIYIIHIQLQYFHSENWKSDGILRKTMRSSQRSVDYIKNLIPYVYMLLWMHSFTRAWELNFLYTEATCISLSFSSWEANSAISMQDSFPRIKCFISWIVIYRFLKSVIWNEDTPQTNILGC